MIFAEVFKRCSLNGDRLVWASLFINGWELEDFAALFTVKGVSADNAAVFQSFWFFFPGFKNFDRAGKTGLFQSVAFNRVGHGVSNGILFHRNIFLIQDVNDELVNGFGWNQSLIIALRDNNRTGFDFGVVWSVGVNYIFGAVVAQHFIYCRVDRSNGLVAFDFTAGASSENHGAESHHDDCNCEID